jgi:hypothetical protein
MNKIITFWPSHSKENAIPPVPARTVVPQWYKDISLYNSSNIPKDARVYNSNDGIDGSALSVKTCGPFYDAMTMGYHYVLPEDIEIVIGKKGLPTIKWESDQFFINRLPNVEFPIPPFYHPIAFTYRMIYGIELPKGSSVLITQPMNRSDLPFWVPSGVVDADTKFAAIDIRLFLKRGFEGVIEKGTPIMQAIPFTRESWNMEVDRDDGKIEERMWLHEKRRKYLQGWYHKHAQVKKEYN